VRPAIIIPIVLVLLTAVVVALPLLLSKPEDIEAAAPNIGVVGLQYAFLDKEYPVVTRVIEESPAALAGIAKDDLLLSVDHRNASMLGDYDIHKELCGEPNSTVQVALRTSDGSIIERNLMRIQASDLPKEADSKYLTEQSHLSKEDFLLRRDAFAKADDFSYTSLIMHNLHQGPMVIEFYAKESGANSDLEAAIDSLNKKDTEAKTSKHNQITKISCNVTDKNYADLVEHFKVTAAPTYIFVPGNRGVILARNIERAPLSPEQIKSKLTDLLYDAQQPIPQIHTAPALVGPEIEDQNSTYTPLSKIKKGPR
jgi:hypothetical protein